MAHPSVFTLGLLEITEFSTCKEYYMALIFDAMLWLCYVYFWYSGEHTAFLMLQMFVFSLLLSIEVYLFLMHLNEMRHSSHWSVCCLSLCNMQPGDFILPYLISYINYQGLFHNAMLSCNFLLKVFLLSKFWWMFSK